MSEEFLKVTDGRTDRRTDTRTEPLPELLSELKTKEKELKRAYIYNGFALGQMIV